MKNISSAALFLTIFKVSITYNIQEEILKGNLTLHEVINFNENNEIYIHDYTFRYLVKSYVIQLIEEFSQCKCNEIARYIEKMNIEKMKELFNYNSILDVAKKRFMRLQALN